MLVYLGVTLPMWVPWIVALRAWPTARTFWLWMRAWTRVVFRLCGFRVLSTREGASGAEVGPAVYVSNHQAMLDIPALTAGIDAPFVFVARGDLRRVPLVSGVLRHSRCVFLDRGVAGGAERAMEACTERLASGESVLFFPEGTRSFDGRVQRFRRGAFQLALLADVPVVPVALGGMHELLDERARAARPGDVRIRVGAPMHARPGETDREFAERAQAEVARLLARA